MPLLFSLYKTFYSKTFFPAFSNLLRFSCSSFETPEKTIFPALISFRTNALKSTQKDMLFARNAEF